MKTPFGFAMLALAAFPVTAQTQQQKVTPPVATYWVSVDTATGFPMGGIGAGGMPAMDIGRVMLGGGMGSSANRSMLLELGSQRSASGAPAARHEIPTGLKMGANLPLETPQQARRPEPRDDGMPQNFEKPRGRMLIYWGCGEQAGPGQPYVVDFARMAQGDVQGLVSRRVNLQRGPSLASSRTYGEWPNPRDGQRVPLDGSLRGEHAVKGNYSPDIQFALADQYDFMEPVRLAMMTKSGGGIKMSWNNVGSAHGYFASAMGAKEGTEEFVYWSSSNSREFGDQLMTWLPPAEVARLVTEKVVLPSATNECIVPVQFVAAAPAAFVRFIAYGEEANFVQPPRPQDPKVEWKQEWTAKVRLKSTATAMLGEGDMAGAPRERGTAADTTGAQSEGAAAQRGAGGELLKEGINVLKGLFGR